MELIAGKVEGGLVLLLGTVSILLKLMLKLPLIQPLFKAGFVLTLVLGCTPPKIGIRTELKLLVWPVLVTRSPLIPVKTLTRPLQLLSPLAPQPRALSFPIM